MNLLWLGMEFAIHRYLIVNTRSGGNGYEKAARHIELSQCYVASHIGCNLDGTYKHHDKVMRIHDATNKLTSYMDKEIGFQIDSDDMNYDKMARKFFNRFIELADEEWEKIEKEGF